MRDLFETTSPENAMAAARRGVRAVPLRRFYDKVAIAADGGNYAVLLDDKPVRTPARRTLAAPTPTLARALIAEWEAQRDTVNPATMPLTRLANAVIDGVADTPDAVAAEIEKYLACDLLFYRAASQPGLVALQVQHWDPILAWARETLQARFVSSQGIIHVAQPAAALAAAAAAIPHDPWRLGATNVVTTLTGSGLLALAMLRGHLSADAAWLAAHIDEDWNMAQWGRDEMAIARRNFRWAEMAAAATVLNSVGDDSGD
jgi:chaperone required for assembly of F1-ATPase